MLRSSRNISKERRKFSAGYKKRNYNDRSKEKEARLFNYRSEEIGNLRNHNNTSLNHATKKHNLNGLIEEYSINLGSTKKIANLDTSKSKHQDFSIIMENIKDVFKSNDKKPRKEGK